MTPPHYRMVDGVPVPVYWWLNGFAWHYAPEWVGRGLHLELGPRAFWALIYGVHP